MPKERNVEEQIMKLLSLRMMTLSKLSKELDMNRSVIKGYIEALKNQGKVKVTKVGKSLCVSRDECS